MSEKSELAQAIRELREEMGKNTQTLSDQTKGLHGLTAALLDKEAVS